MPSIFNTLNIGYTGLSAAQNGIDTTGHNIVNANVDGYSRQKVIQSAATPISSKIGNVGNGVDVTNIKRVFDNFVFDQYSKSSSSKEYSDFEHKTLDELSTYFPEVDGVGVKADLQEYYKMWQTFSDNPDNDSIKLALAKQTQTLTQHIALNQNQVKSLQKQVNDELDVNIKEVNTLTKELASLNISIDKAEAGSKYSANDLRDKRNIIERSLSRLIGATVNNGALSSDIKIDSSSNTRSGSYTLSINGFNIVDGSSYHPLVADNSKNPNGFYSISYERQDGVKIPLEETITGGKIGAILDLRGGILDTTSGVPNDGIIQKSVSQMDAFAKSLIESSNNLYASTSTTRMESNQLDIDSATPLLNTNLNIKKGSFDLVVYDVDGNTVAKRAINIDSSTTMAGVAGSNSIQAQVEAVKDDNGDNNASDDINSFINFNWATPASGVNTLELTLKPPNDSSGYSFAIDDVLSDSNFSSGTNFAGALGLHKFLDGDNATNIRLNKIFSDNPTKISAGLSAISGDNRVALDMVQNQFEKYDHKVVDQVYNTTSLGMFDVVATEVGISANSAKSKNDAISTQFNAIKLEYDSVSRVNIDEEMTNLIKYQTSYGASAKLIKTVDEMMQTLLGLKQ